MGRTCAVPGVSQAFRLAKEVDTAGPKGRLEIPDTMCEATTTKTSMIKFCPVTARYHGEAKNSAASGVVTRPSGVAVAIRSNTAFGVAALASVVLSRPPVAMVTVTLRGQALCDYAGKGKKSNFGSGLVVSGHNWIFLRQISATDVPSTP